MKLHPFYFLVFSFLTACGGGGGSSDSPATPSNPSVPVLPDTGWTPTEPRYTGLQTAYEIDEKNVVETVYSTLESLDLLTSFAFADRVSSFYFFAESESNALSGDVPCESGSFSEDEVEAQRRIELKYDACLIDGAEVNGTLRVERQNDNTINVMPSLTLQTISTGEVLALTGFYNVNDRDSATFNLMMESNSGEQLFFDNFSLSTSYFGNAFGIEFKGDLYISDQGQLSVDTIELGPHTSNRDVEFATTSIQIEGDELVLFDVELQHRLLVQYNPEYLTTEIPLDGSVEVDFDKENVNPTAEVSANSFEFVRTAQHQVSAELSSDPNFDPLKATWEIVSQPQDSNVSLVQGNSVTVEADLPGTYTLRLTVTDRQGNLGTKDVDLTITRNAPSGEFVESGPYRISEPVIAQLSLDNDQYDEPMDYQVKYGPANLSVSDTGEVTWDGAIPDYGQNVEVNLAILVSNPDAHEVFEHTLTLNSKDTPILRKRAHSGAKIMGANQRGESGALYSIDNLVSEFVVDGASMSEKDRWVIRPTTSAEISYQATSDVNKDGVDDFWYSWIDGPEGQYRVYWQDGATSESHLFKEYDRVSNSVLGVSTLDYDQDGDREVFISNGLIGTQVFDASSGDLLLERDVTIKDRHYCDYNQDGFLDIIDSRGNFRISEGFDLETGTTLPEFDLHAQFFDADGTSTCEYLLLDDSDQLVYKKYGAEDHVVLFDLSGYIWGREYYAADIDNDGKQEVLVLVTEFVSGEGFVSHDYILDNVDTSNFSITKLDYELPSSPTVRDIDNDGIEELLISVREDRALNAGRQTEFNQVFAYNATINGITQLAQSEPFSPNKFSLVQWAENGDLSTTSKDTFWTHLLELPSDNQIRHNLLAASISDVVIENNVTYVYRSDPESGHATKVDFMENQIWSTDIQNGEIFGIQGVDVLTGGLTLFNFFNSDSLLHPDTGEVMINIPKTIGFSGTQYVYNLGEDGIQRFATMRGRKFLEIASDFSVNTLSTPQVDEILNSSTHYSFTQADKDPQPELVVYSTFAQTYRVIDSVTLEEQLPGPLFSGTTDISRNLPRSNTLECFIWDSQCRNYVAGRNGGFGYDVIDKLTGKVIWSSPQIGQWGSTFQFRRATNEIQTFITSPYSWMMTIE